MQIIANIFSRIAIKLLFLVLQLSSGKLKFSWKVHTKCIYLNIQLKNSDG